MGSEVVKLSGLSEVVRVYIHHFQVMRQRIRRYNIAAVFVAQCYVGDDWCGGVLAMDASPLLGDVIKQRAAALSSESTCAPSRDSVRGARHGSSTKTFHGPHNRQP